MRGEALSETNVEREGSNSKLHTMHLCLLNSFSETHT